MNPPSPSELTFVAIQAALSAGTLLRHGFGTSFEISTKGHDKDLVTAYDKASEKAIISFIKQHYSDHAFVAEESGETHEKRVTWIIDPLDGTVNFAHNVPVFSISIAAAIDKEIVSGVVFQPLTQELFIAEKNRGSYLNGKRLQVSKTQTLKDSLLATGFPYNVEENPLRCIDRFAQIQGRGIPVRRLGSAAIDMCYVAAGRFDAYWEVGLHAWDMAAGKLIVEEAGGKVTHYDGSEHKIFGYENIVVSNGVLHAAMIEHLNQKDGWKR